jgi:hypothetical protein
MQFGHSADAKQKNVPEDKQGQFGYGDVWWQYPRRAWPIGLSLAAALP